MKLNALFVSSTGGHLAEMHLLAQRMATTSRTWVTFDSAQSRSLLDGERVEFAPPASSRDLAGTARDYLFARKLLRNERFDVVVSTGAAIAVAFLPLAARHGAQSHYIESATRLAGPSMTGRLLARFPRVNLHTQHASWATDRWHHTGSVFDQYRAQLSPRREVRRVVVSLGTHRKYGFERALRRLVQIIPPDVEVLWQAGSTDAAHLGIDVRDTVPVDELKEAIASADAVITHAGVGSALSVLEAGKRPVYIPRRHHFGEHVDNHQVDLANELSDRSLVISREADQVTWLDVQEAASSIVGTVTLPPLDLATIDLTDDVRRPSNKRVSIKR